jgi:hypothetical protein
VQREDQTWAQPIDECEARHETLVRLGELALDCSPQLATGLSIDDLVRWIAAHGGIGPDAVVPVVDPERVILPTIMMRRQFDGLAGLDDLLGFFRRPPNPDKQFAVMPGTPHVSFSRRAIASSTTSARGFFTSYFVEYADAVVTCTSWLLDDQLLDYFPPDSNIILFQRRFVLVPGARNSDESAFHFVFGREPDAIDPVTPRTTLERVIVRHVKQVVNGLRSGWLELPA